RRRALERARERRRRRRRGLAEEVLLERRAFVEVGDLVARDLDVAVAAAAVDLEDDRLGAGGQDLADERPAVLEHDGVGARRFAERERAGDGERQERAPEP